MIESRIGRTERVELRERGQQSLALPAPIAFHGQEAQHQLGQGRRRRLDGRPEECADDLMFLNNSEIVEAGPTARLFDNPAHNLTARYLSGEMG